MAAGGMTGMAGCLGGGDDGGDNNQTERDPGNDERSDPLPDDGEGSEEIEVGGTFTFGVERDSIGNYDLAESTLADDSMVLGTLYDGLRVQNTSGEFYNWMAEEYGVDTANDVSMPDDYVDYMEPREIGNVEENDNGDRIPTFDLGDNNLVFPTSQTAIGIAAHPDDIEAIQNGELEAGDDMRVLTREEAEAAANDGTFGVRVTGRLREGITFHNGDELTATDLVGSYDRFVGSTNQGQVFSSFLHAQEPDDGDDYTFELYAQEADAIAPSALPPFQIYPEAHHDVPPGGLDPRSNDRQPIGTGAYQIEEFSEGEFLTLSRYEDYWAADFGVENFEWIGETLPDDRDPEAFPDEPVVETLEIEFLPEGSQRVAALETEELDASYQLSPSEYTNFDGQENYRVSAARSTGFLFMQMPISTDSDYDLSGADEQGRAARQAVQMMIPRQSIVDTVSDGWADPARLPFPQPAAGLASASGYEELFEEDWSYPVEPQPDEAEQLLSDAGLDTPVSLTIDTNADDSTRIQKMELVAGEMTSSGLFEASVETPANINDWFAQTLIQPGSRNNYASNNKVAVIGLAAGFDPHGYAQALHSPNNFNGCCNFFHPQDTFDWISTLEEARFTTEAAESVEFRQNTYDEIWPQIAEDVGNTIIDFSFEVTVAGPKVRGYDAYPDRRGFLTWSIWAPYENQVTLLDIDEHNV